MSRQQITNHYTRLLRLWPIDRLRQPERSFQHLLQSRIAAAPTVGEDESREVNAAYLLLDNAFGKQSPLSNKIMKPASDPAHYENLARELEEVPDRSWFERVKKRLGGLVRMR